VEQAAEQALILRAQAGDRDAFAELAEEYWGRIYRFLCKTLRCAHTAEDLTQDVFLKAWAALKTFQAGTSIRAWLFRIASNRFIDSRRGPRGLPVAILPATLASREPGPVGVALADECQARIDRAVEMLPVDLRSVFLLRVQEGLPFAEIAEMFEITEETARWRLFKARQMLLNDLGDYLDKPNS
jgi:RNA polymerase sigma-70 factor (ECF subfamily)